MQTSLLLQISLKKLFQKIKMTIFETTITIIVEKGQKISLRDILFEEFYVSFVFKPDIEYCLYYSTQDKSICLKDLNKTKIKEIGIDKKNNNYVKMTFSTANFFNHVNNKERLVRKMLEDINDYS